MTSLLRKARNRLRMGSFVERTLSKAKASYLRSFVSRLPGAVATAEDVVALAVISESGLDLSWRLVVATAILLVTIAVLALGLRTAPMTRIDIRAVANHVTVVSANKTDARLTISSATSANYLELWGAGTVEATLLRARASPVAASPCSILDISSRVIKLLHPERVSFLYAPGSSLTFSALKTDGSNRYRRLQIDGDGPWTVSATLPLLPTALPGSCKDLEAGSWSVPAKLTFFPPGPRAEISGQSILIEVPGAESDAPQATAVLSPLILNATSVDFDDAVVGGPQMQSIPFRCAIQSGTVDYVQRLPLVGVEFTGHEELRNRQCPMPRLGKGAIWKVSIRPSNDGLFEVVQSANGSDGQGSLFVEGAGRGREVGKSYIAIVKEDAGLALIVSVIAVVFSNLWSVAQLLRRWTA